MTLAIENGNVAPTKVKILQGQQGSTASKRADLALKGFQKCGHASARERERERDRQRERESAVEDGKWYTYVEFEDYSKGSY